MTWSQVSKDQNAQDFRSRFAHQQNNAELEVARATSRAASLEIELRQSKGMLQILNNNVQSEEMAARKFAQKFLNEQEAASASRAELNMQFMDSQTMQAETVRKADASSMRMQRELIEAQQAKLRFQIENKNKIDGLELQLAAMNAVSSAETNEAAAHQLTMKNILSQEMHAAHNAEISAYQEHANAEMSQIAMQRDNAERQRLELAR